MPIWLQLIWGVSGPVIVAILCWLGKNILSLKVKVAELETRLNEKDDLCNQRKNEVDKVFEMVRMCGRNIIRLGIHHGVKDLETE